MGNTCCTEGKPAEDEQEVEAQPEKVKELAEEPTLVPISAEEKEATQPISAEEPEASEQKAPQAVAAEEEPKAVAAEEAPKAVAVEEEPKAVAAEEEPKAAAAEEEPPKDGAYEAGYALQSAAANVVEVRFKDGKGQEQTVCFAARPLGFSCKASTGCMCKAPKATPTVTKVDKNKQADKQGVKKGWTVVSIAGQEVTDRQQATQLMEDKSTPLPEEAK